MMTDSAVRYVSAVVSDKGLSEKRPVNEDSYLEMPERGVFAVADGVGGAQAGDVASQMAMETLFEAFSHSQPNVDSEELMEMAIQRANQSIFQMSRELPQLDMMATTIVALHVDGNVATIGHVGDSRLYRLDPLGNLFRETQDHSVVEEEVRAGRMTSAQAANHPSRNVISRALGAEDTVEVDLKTIMFEPETTFLLCSDGITRHVQDAEMRQMLMSIRSPEDVCRELREICYSRGAEDNLTAVVIRAEQTGVGAFNDDEDITITGTRAASATNGAHSFVAPPNGNAAVIPTSPLDPSFISATQTEELRQQEYVDSEASTAPLNAPAPVSDVPPAIETKDNFVSEAVPAETNADSGSTPGSKVVNERIRAKIDAAEPPIYENLTPEHQGSTTGKLLTWLLLLLVGAAIGAGLLYALMPAQQPPPPRSSAPVAPATSQQSAPPQQSTPVGDLSQAEVTEFRTFERVRRLYDKKPAAAVAADGNVPNSAADHYLRGRAFLQIGRYEEALQSLKSAESMWRDSADVDRETLRADIAIAQAALAAMARNQNTARMLGELVKEKQASAVPPATGANP